MSGLLHLGPCPTCGKAFESRDRKTFCSMNCYHRSDRWKEICKEKAAAQTIRVRRACRCCGTEFEAKPSARRHYCSKICQRRWFAERHDRWVANPQKIALPQAYDEFLSQDELRCIIEGCDWTGQSLAMHVNLVHGVPAAEFKALAGFNNGTGLVSAELFKVLSERPYSHLHENPEALEARLTTMRTRLREHDGAKRPEARLEGREHARKNMAERRAAPPEITYACERCKTLFARVGLKNNTKFCPPCRPLVHAERRAERNTLLACSKCQGGFQGNQSQRLRAARKLVVLCAPCLAEERAAKLARGRANIKRQRNVPERGPCPTCGKMFHHYAPLKFCSRTCQQAAPDFKELMLKNLASKRARQ